MKFGTKGALTCARTIRSIQGYNGVETSALIAFRTARENGTAVDSPPYCCPYDGKMVEHPVPGNEWMHGLIYESGQGDIKWMEEKDSNYISRLARERHQRQLSEKESTDFEEGMQRVDIAERVNKEEKARESETISQDKLSETTNQNRGAAKMKILNLVTLLKAIKANSIEEVDLSEQLPDYQNATIERTLTGHSGYISALQILPNGGLASGSYDNTIRIWNTETGACEQTLTGHSGYISALQILPNGGFASGSYDNTIRIWNTETGACERTLTGHSRCIRALQIFPNGGFASASDDKTIRIWNTETGACEQTLTGHSGYISALQILPNGGFASASYDNTIRIWNTETGACEQTLTGHSSCILALQILPNERLASASNDKTIRIWNTETGACEQTLTGHSSCILALQILPNGGLASGSYDNTIRIWNTETGACERTLTGHSSIILALQILPNGGFASASDDKTIRIWKPNYHLVNTQEFTKVITMLYSNTSVKTLNLRELTLDIKAIEKLVKLLQTSNQLECIDLSESNFNDVFAEVLIPALQQSHSLKQLYLSNTELSSVTQKRIQLLFLKKDDAKNNTILHLAARKGYLEYIQQCIHLNLENCQKKNTEGKTALDLARENQHQEIVDFLEEQVSIKKHQKKVEQLQEEQANLSRTVEAKFKQQESTHKKLATGLKTQIDQQTGKMQADQSRFNQKVTQKIETVESQQQALQEQLEVATLIRTQRLK